jgi:pimeloyl-ACP methyl ester carboxylesterase
VKCRTGRIDVHYEAFGEGRPLFVIPGWPDSWRVPADYLEPVFVDRPGWRRLYIDLPGRGETSAPPWIESNDDVLDVVVDVIGRLAPTGGLVLAGHSAGAYLARGVLRRLFDRVDGLLQVVPVIRVQEQVLPPQSTIVANPDLVARLADEFGAEIAGLFASRIVTQTPAVYESFRRLLPASQDHDGPFLARIAAREELSLDVDDASSPFARPALFLLGRQDDVVGFESALDVITAYPRATVAVMDAAGHALPWEQPEPFAALVRAWLDRVESEVASDIPPR